VTKTPVAPAAPTDWHQSWGKPDASKTPAPELKIETVKPVVSQPPVPQIKFETVKKDPPIVEPVKTSKVDKTDSPFDKIDAKSVSSSGGTQSVPVPLVTVPDYRHPPQPPAANIPQAPQVNLQVNGNAFGQQGPAPAAPEGAGQAVNAFSSMQASPTAPPPPA